MQIAAAVAHVHGRGYSHNDIKSDNVFVNIDETGEIDLKLGDFGEAAMFGTEQFGTTSTAGLVPSLPLPAAACFKFRVCRTSCSGLLTTS